MNQVKLGAFIAYLAIIGNILVAIIYTPFFIRHLGTSNYGLYNLVISFIGYISILDLSFGNTITKYLSQNRIYGTKEKESIFLGKIFYLYLFATIIMVLISIFIFKNIDKIFGIGLTNNQIIDLKIMFIFLIVHIFISFYPSIFNGILQSYEYFVIAKTTLLIRVILPSIIATPFLLSGFGAKTIIVITLLVNFICSLIGLYYCKKKINIKFNLSFKVLNLNIIEFKNMNKYLLIALLSIAVEQLTLNTGQIILGAMNGTISVAIFVIAIQFIKIYQQFATSINNVTFPRFAMLVSNDTESKLLLENMIKVSRVQLIVLLTIFSGFVIFGREFIIMWAGKDFEPAYPMTIILMGSIIFQLCQLPGVSILQAKEKQGFRLFILTITLLLSVISSIYLANKFDGLGVSISMAIFSFITYTLLMNIYFHRNMDLNMFTFWKENLKIALPIIILTLIFKVIYLKIIHLEFNILIFIISLLTYLILLAFTLWKFIMSNSEKANIIKKIRR